MGWTFHWVSSFDNDFNRDFGVGFTPDEQDAPVYNYGGNAPGMAEREGVSVFVKDADGAVFHTYSAYARGIDMLNAAYHYIDLTPKGRDEVGQGTFRSSGCAATTSTTGSRFHVKTAGAAAATVDTPCAPLSSRYSRRSPPSCSCSGSGTGAAGSGTPRARS